MDEVDENFISSDESLKDDVIISLSFANADEAEGIAQKLDELGLYYEWDDKSIEYDAEGTQYIQGKNILLRFREGDRQLVYNLAQVPIHHEIVVQHDFHYEASTRLYDHLTQPDLWSTEEINLALAILHDREFSLEINELNRILQGRINELSSPEERNWTGIIFGYILAVVTGLGGLAMGLMYLLAKKRTPSGEKIYMFKEADRDHGIAMILIVIGLAYFAITTEKDVVLWTVPLHK